MIKSPEIGPLLRSSPSEVVGHSLPAAGPARPSLYRNTAEDGRAITEHNNNMPFHAPVARSVLTPRRVTERNEQDAPSYYLPPNLKLRPFGIRPNSTKFDQIRPFFHP